MARPVIKSGARLVVKMLGLVRYFCKALYYLVLHTVLSMLSSNLEYRKSRDCSRSILGFQV